MTEPTGIDADDDAERTQQQLTGALRDELGARHLRYRRALEVHMERVQQHLLLVQASASDPTQELPRSLANSWHSVREARKLYDAARLALRDHRRLQ